MFFLTVHSATQLSFFGPKMQLGGGNMEVLVLPVAMLWFYSTVNSDDCNLDLNIQVPTANPSFISAFTHCYPRPYAMDCCIEMHSDSFPGVVLIVEELIASVGIMGKQWENDHHWRAFFFFLVLPCIFTVNELI